MRTIILTAVALSGLALTGCESRTNENGSTTITTSENAGTMIENGASDLGNGAEDLVNGAGNLAAKAGDVIQNTAADVGNATRNVGQDTDRATDRAANTSVTVNTNGR